MRKLQHVHDGPDFTAFFLFLQLDLCLHIPMVIRVLFLSVIPNLPDGKGSAVQGIGNDKFILFTLAVIADFIINHHRFSVLLCREGSGLTAFHQSGFVFPVSFKDTVISRFHNRLKCSAPVILFCQLQLLHNIPVCAALIFFGQSDLDDRVLMAVQLILPDLSDGIGLPVQLVGNDIVLVILQIVTDYISLSYSLLTLFHFEDACISTFIIQQVIFVILFSDSVFVTVPDGNRRKGSSPVSAFRKLKLFQGLPYAPFFSEKHSPDHGIPVIIHVIFPYLLNRKYLLLIEFTRGILDNGTALIFSAEVCNIRRCIGTRHRLAIFIHG